MKVVTCPTDGCENQGVELLWDYDALLAAQASAAAEGEPFVIGGFLCGSCGTDITDTARDVPDDYQPTADEGGL